MMIDFAAMLRAAGRLWQSHSLRLALILVVPYACILIGLDLAAHYGDATGAALPWQFFISQDGSFGEYLEYSLTASCAVLLFLLWRRTGMLVYLTSAILFVYLTIDNSIELHEQLGLAVGSEGGSFMGLPIAANHLVETGLFGLVGLIWLAGMVAALRHADRRAASYSLLIAACIIMAAVFGVVVDLATSWGEHDAFSLNALAAIEDDGEFVMIIMAFALCVGVYDLEGRRSEQRTGPMQPGETITTG